jgi:hypothetical protein
VSGIMKEASLEPVRRAIAVGDFAHALELWNGYAAALAGGKPTDAKLAEAAELIDWSRPFLLRGHEHAAVRLRAPHVAGAYGSCPDGPNLRFRARL